MKTIDLRPALIIARREVRDQFRDWRIIFPIVFLTLFFPFLMNFTARQLLDFVNQYGAGLVGERLIPFLLLITGFFPISVSLVIALESFVGEKERGSIEPLLTTPLVDWQLYLGKLLSSTVPPLIGSFLGMSVYIGGLVVNRIPLPDAEIMLQIIILTVTQAVVMVSGAVVVSTQATSVRAANLLASFIIIPMALLIQAEAVVMFWGRDTLSLWWVVFGLLVLAVLLIRVGLAHFQREELLGREIDVLNLRWIWRIFWENFTGGARNPLIWYRQVLAGTLHELRGSLLIVTFLAGMVIFLGAQQADRFLLILPEGSLQERIRELQMNFSVGEVGSVQQIFFQNVRALTVGLVLGLFSFGVLGTLPLLATLGLLGYFTRILEVNQLPAAQIIFSGIVPHGILEVPAILISTAAVLRIGFLLATPMKDKTVGEVFLMAIAGWLQVMIGVVIPLLLLAAAVEAWITPLIIFRFLG
ncbi:MAG: stage II sporulation protein M [Chloroflexota bacterium]